MVEVAAKAEAILEAALELFAERGFHGTAVPLIAEKAGIGAGTVYRHFESKEALVNALYRRCKGEFLAAMLEGFPANASVRAQFGEMWRRTWGFARSHPKAFSFLELHHHAPYLDAQSRAMDEQVMRPAIELITSAQRTQEVKPMEPAAMMWLVHGAIVGLVRAAQAGMLKLDDTLLASLEQCMWEAVRR